VSSSSHFSVTAKMHKNINGKFQLSILNMNKCIFILYELIKWSAFQAITKWKGELFQISGHNNLYLILRWLSIINYLWFYAPMMNVDCPHWLLYQMIWFVALLSLNFQGYRNVTIGISHLERKTWAKRPWSPLYYIVDI